MIVTGRRKRLRNGLFGRYFNTYFGDQMSSLTNPTNTEIRDTFSGYSVSTTDTWLFRGYFLAGTTATNWQFRTTSDDASYLWIGTNSEAIDTSLNTSNAAVNNGGLHSSRTRTSGNLSLTSGVYYPFAVVIGNNTGPGTLTVEWSDNGGTSWFSNGNQIFFYNPFAPNGFNLE